jgi:hypothetical protein
MLLGLAHALVVRDVLADADQAHRLVVVVTNHFALGAHVDLAAVGPDDALDVLERLVVGEGLPVALVDRGRSSGWT